MIGSMPSALRAAQWCLVAAVTILPGYISAREGAPYPVEFRNSCDSPRAHQIHARDFVTLALLF